MTAGLTVAFLDHTTEPGGAELALARVLQHAPEGVNASVFVPRGRRGAYDRPGVRCVSVGSPQRPGAATARGVRSFLEPVVGVLRQALALRSSRHFRASDVVVANTSRAAVYGYLACLGTRKAFVVHVRDEICPAALGPVGFPAVRLALRAAHLVIANSQHTLDLAEPFLEARAARVVIASPTGMPVREPWWPTPAPVRRVGMVARIDPWKGHELLLRAFRLAFPEPGVDLHLAGSAAFGLESHLDRLHALVGELGLDERVHFAGQVLDVTGFIDGLDLCVQCSLRPEPLGQNVLQYLARRRPTIAASGGGPAEWVEHGQNGVLFERGDVDGLAAALRSTAADWSFRAKVMSSGRVRVQDDATVAAQVYSALRQVAARRDGLQEVAGATLPGLKGSGDPSEGNTGSPRRPDVDRVNLRHMRQRSPVGDVLSQDGGRAG